MLEISPCDIYTTKGTIYYNIVAIVFGAAGAVCYNVAFSSPWSFFTSYAKFLSQREAQKFIGESEQPEHKCQIEVFQSILAFMA